ncbi:MAG: bifunctional glutamate N-acetyltransferase/amino-acid acetyltransferase ArgJ [Actinobacteria bacterium]|nr:bifunctional glutamate N-acetyltransferase/amino-acid acetyltransferase ArgJ [Actinomycetota bacterium]
MSVTSAQGFQASGVVAGLKASGLADVALVVNTGPDFVAAGVFTANKIKAAPVIWSAQVLKSGELRVVALNSGGANACTGPQGFADTHRSAEYVAALLDCGAGEVAVCSTGLIGELLPMDKLLSGYDAAAAALASDGGQAAAEAIMTTDTVAKTASVSMGEFTVGGMAKGAGMLAPGLATMLSVITTDAVVDASTLDVVLREAVSTTFDRIDSDGCMSTNDTVLLLASGASGYNPTIEELQSATTAVCKQLSRALIGDAEGSSKDIHIAIAGAASESDALTVARAISRSNLLKCAIHGEDPNWGRVISAAGTTNAEFEPDEIAVAINGIWVCRNGSVGEDRNLVDMSGREVVISVDLRAGDVGLSLWTNDLTADYVHENSAYST